MKRFLLIFILYSSQAPAQSNPGTGKVVADPNFNCSNYSFIDPVYGSLEFIDTMYGIKNICESKSQIEVRFSTLYGPGPHFEIFILTYDHNEWEGKVFKFNIDTIYHDSASNANEGKITVAKIENTGALNGVFLELTKNNLFSLPDMDLIKRKPEGPSCGIIHSITFKVDNKYRTYSFNNTEYYVQNSRKEIFRDYANIVELLKQFRVE